MLIALVLLPLVLISTGADSSGANKTMIKALCYHCFPLADPKNLHQLRKKNTDLSPFSIPALCQPLMSTLDCLIFYHGRNQISLITSVIIFVIFSYHISVAQFFVHHQAEFGKLEETRSVNVHLGASRQTNLDLDDHHLPC